MAQRKLAEVSGEEAENQGKMEIKDKEMDALREKMSGD